MIMIFVRKKIREEKKNQLFIFHPTYYYNTYIEKKRETDWRLSYPQKISN